jgi:uncharacterized membrane protein YidH (DUF202 family)
MFYRLLGMAVWKALKLFLRRRYGRTYLPRPLLAGLLLVVVGAIVAVVTRRETS